jgi:hypothetical protein
LSSSEFQALSRKFVGVYSLQTFKHRVLRPLERFGFLYTGQPRKELQRFIDRLHPETTNIPLIRMGGPGDGGYLVPDDLDGIAALFSPGVAERSSFEADALARGMEVHLADASVAGPASGISGMPKVHFRKEFVGAWGRTDRLSLREWVMDSSVEASADLLAQIDIEGAEYELLLDATPELLNRFRVLVIEFHFVEWWSSPGMFQVVEAALGRLLETHRVVHAHPNNWLGTKNVQGVHLPPLIELTFHRRDRAEFVDWASQIPHRLDASNAPDRPEVALPLNWWGGPKDR